MFSGKRFTILAMFVLVLALIADSMCLYLSDQAGVGQLDSRLIAAWNCRIVGTGNKLSTKYGFKIDLFWEDTGFTYTKGLQLWIPCYVVLRYNINIMNSIKFSLKYFPILKFNWYSSLNDFFPQHRMETSASLKGGVARFSIFWP